MYKSAWSLNISSDFVPTCPFASFLDPVPPWLLVSSLNCQLLVAAVSELSPFMFLLFSAFVLDVFPLVCFFFVPSWLTTDSLWHPLTPFEPQLYSASWLEKTFSSFIFLHDGSLWLLLSPIARVSFFWFTGENGCCFDTLTPSLDFLSHVASLGLIGKRCFPVIIQKRFCAPFILPSSKVPRNRIT